MIKENKMILCPSCDKGNLQLRYARNNDEKRTWYNYWWCDDCNKKVDVPRLITGHEQIEKEKVYVKDNEVYDGIDNGYDDNDWFRFD